MPDNQNQCSSQLNKCIQCGSEIRLEVANKRNRVYVKKYCSSSCLNAYRNNKPNAIENRRQYFSRKTQIAKELRGIKQCEWCKKDFAPKAVTTLCCSHRCSKRAWKKRNWDKVLEDQRKWFKKKVQENPEQLRQYQRDRKHRIRANGGKVTLEQWESLKRLHNYTCVFCKRKEPEIKLTQDHIIPITKNGVHDITNLQPLCVSCNSTKHNKVDFTPALNII